MRKDGDIGSNTQHPAIRCLTRKQLFVYTHFAGLEMNEQLQATACEKNCQVSPSGYDLINSPRLNKGTAFSDYERDLFGLHGLLPPQEFSIIYRLTAGIERYKTWSSSTFSERTVSAIPALSIF